MKDFEQLNRDRFPNLVWGEFRCLNNREERLGIDDLSFKGPTFKDQLKEAIEMVVISCRGFLYVYSAEELSRALSYQLDNILERLNPENSLLIFPGNGAQVVKELIDQRIFKYFPSLDLKMRRVLSPNMSVSQVDVLTSKSEIRKMVPKKLYSCVLVDDVIASGNTAQSVKIYVDINQEYEWQAATWMMLSPLQVRARKDDQYRSGLTGYKKVFASVLYQGENGIPANNSLSSFAEVDEKAESILARYKDKYVEDIGMFEEAINLLRRYYDSR